MRDIAIRQNELFHDGDPYHCQYTDLYMIGTSVMNELKSLHLTLPLVSSKDLH